MLLVEPRSWMSCLPNRAFGTEHDPLLLGLNAWVRVSFAHTRVIDPDVLKPRTNDKAG
jgi:hypothetical protein